VKNNLLIPLTLCASLLVADLSLYSTEQKQGGIADRVKNSLNAMPVSWPYWLGGLGLATAAGVGYTYLGKKNAVSSQEASADKNRLDKKLRIIADKVENLEQKESFDTFALPTAVALNKTKRLINYVSGSQSDIGTKVSTEHVESLLNKFYTLITKMENPLLSKVLKRKLAVLTEEVVKEEQNLHQEEYKKLTERFNEVTSEIDELKKDSKFQDLKAASDDLFKKVNPLMKDLIKYQNSSQNYKENIGFDSLVHDTNVLLNDLQQVVVKIKNTNASRNGLWQKIIARITGTSLTKTLENELAEIGTRARKHIERIFREEYIDQNLETLKKRLEKTTLDLGDLQSENLEHDGSFNGLISGLKNKLTIATKLIDELKRRKNNSREDEIMEIQGDAEARTLDKIKTSLWVAAPLLDEVDKAIIQARSTLSEGSEGNESAFPLVQDFKDTLLALNRILKDFRKSPEDLKDLMEDRQIKTGTKSFPMDDKKKIVLLKDLKELNTMAEENQQKLSEINKKAQELESIRLDRILSMEDVKKQKIVEKTREMQEFIRDLLKIKQSLRNPNL
jgi:hypothetical protein